MTEITILSFLRKSGFSGVSHEPQPYHSYIFEAIALLFITLVLPFLVHRICCRSRNQQHNTEEIELGYIGVGRVDMDLFSISIFSSDVTDSICAICTCAFANGDQFITLPICGHIYHYECITPHFTSYSSWCPTCRHDYGDYSIDYEA